MDTAVVRTHVKELWDRSIIGELTEYVRIPNKSPAFDPEWKTHGHMDRVVARFTEWARRRAPDGSTVDVVRLEGRTPVLFIDVPGDSSDCILLYGHMDKQPEMTGWNEGLGPWNPVLRDDRLYGRGASDDGYSMFAAVAALGALHAQKVHHARCVILI
jgi:acetylornithine deacetylase/succinyl-diaminopimelate desuccinylase-like protein